MIQDCDIILLKYFTLLIYFIPLKYFILLKFSNSTQLSLRYCSLLKYFKNKIFLPSDISNVVDISTCIVLSTDYLSIGLPMVKRLMSETPAEVIGPHLHILKSLTYTFSNYTARNWMRTICMQL